MLRVSPDLSQYACAAGEPFLFEVQLQEVTGAVTDLSARAFVLSFYGPGRRPIEKIDPDLLTDATGAFLRFARDGRFSDSLFGQSVTVELAERYKNGRNVLATGVMMIAASSGGVQTFDNGVVGRFVVRATLKANASQPGVLTPSVQILPYQADLGTPAPTFTTAPSISRSGSRLTGSDGVIANGTAKTREWLLGSTILATGSTYDLTGMEDGTITFRVLAEGPGGTARVSSAPISVTPTAKTLNGYYANGSTNTKLKAAIARVTGGTGRGMIVYAGDSITTGQGGGTGTNGITGARPFRFPSKVAELLTKAGIPTLDNGIESDNGAYVGGSSLAGYDPRVTAGGWQNAAGMNFSGGGFLRPSPDNPLTLTIPAVDTFVVIPYNSAVVTYTAQIDGAAPASGGSFSSTSAGSFTKAEVKAGSLGSHTISLLGATSGAFRSVRAYNSAQSAFDTSVHSALGASSSQQASTGGTNWNAVEALKFDAPDLTIIMVGTNDMFNAVDIGTYTSALQTLVNAGKVSGDVLLLFPPPGNGRYNTNVSDYNAAAKGVAATAGVAFFSFWEYYGPFTTDFAARLYDAQVHPKAELYAEMGGLIKQAIDLMRS